MAPGEGGGALTVEKGDSARADPKDSPCLGERRHPGYVFRNRREQRWYRGPHKEWEPLEQESRLQGEP